jgi:hypothetical protein
VPPRVGRTISEIIDTLCNKIGVRFAGTPPDRDAALYVKTRFEKLGLDAKIQEFKFVAWEPLEAPKLEITEPQERHMPCFATVWSGSTPEKGIEGHLQHVGKVSFMPSIMEWNKYAIVDTKSGEPLAYVIARHHGGPGHDGAAIPVALDDVPVPISMPQVVINAEDGSFLENLIESRKNIKVRLQVLTTYRPGSSLFNVIATLNGETEPEKEIVVCAHHDSQYNTVGANDNASGVAGVVELAKALVERKSAKTIKFITFDGEEFFGLGSRFYVRRRKELGDLKKVVGVVCLDIIGGGTNFGSWASPEALRNEVTDIAEESDITKRYPWWEMLDYKSFPASDHSRFSLEEIPSVMLFFWPQKEYHLAEDLPDRIENKCIDGVVSIASRIVQRLDKRLYPII